MNPAPSTEDRNRPAPISLQDQHGRKPVLRTTFTDVKTRSPRSSPAPRPVARHLMILQVLWILMLCLLGAWWVSLMLDQAGRIAGLEQQLGVTEVEAQRQWLRTQRMLYWEGGTFFAALVVSLLLLAWLHWRDNRRARALQAFFASVTHELRTPLASARLEAEGLAEVLPPGTPGRPLVDRLLEDTTRLEAQVERALELARLEGGGRLITRPVGLRPVVTQFLRTWRPHPGRRVEFRNEVEDLAILADPSSLQTILRNLLENSVRYGSVDPLVVTLRSETAPGIARLIVRDNGGPSDGLPQELGGLFARGSVSTGAGVGLYLVRQLMQRMGGGADFKPGRAAEPDPGFEARLTFQEEPHHG